MAPRRRNNTQSARACHRTTMQLLLGNAKEATKPVLSVLHFLNARTALRWRIHPLSARAKSVAPMSWICVAH